MSELDLDAVSALTTEERAYIAGFFDGEGTVGVYRVGDDRYSMRVAIGQRKTTVLTWLQSIFGGSMTDRNGSTHGGAVWLWAINSEDSAKVFLRIIKPYAREKIDQIELALQFVGGNYDHNAEISAQLMTLKRA